ncbi:ATP-dependent helicase HrpB [Martelella endophytica]|uniref:ATP-dependent helicase n=1 Tax=Martelella endophytica TaxID=1486262 RepID=A0A0D5LLX0_MAREN|nr:ATP-dependent helicase HrpB [Martelella endophytica]AJY45151.1 ATP-dependent helicase [Martelella endophytica]
MPEDALPVAEVLDMLSSALAGRGLAVLSAPPGAGKTTLVPLHLLQSGAAGNGRIILLEPRRLAASAAAFRMASLLGEEPGGTVGYRMRLDTRVSARTRIEVVTEGVFARMALDDPELAGVSTVIFDEFHERSLDADFGLALALDIRSGLREDLKLLVMSATLDVGRIASLLGDAPVIESAGRAYPVDIRHRPRTPQGRIEDDVVAAILDMLKVEAGSILAFLPGQAEIRRTAERLEHRIGSDVTLAPLYGNLTRAEQDAAIAPTQPGRRKVVLSTAIAETSITIDGVTIVIDSGLQRLPVFEPATGITRLETVKVSRASADQRAGRAGRTAPGIALRLWHEGQTAALAAFTRPEILASDLSGLVLDLAHWGVADPGQLAFLDPPPGPALAEAKRLVGALGALDDDGRLTPTGERMRGLSLPPRLAAMVIHAAAAGTARDAAMLAVLLSEQGLGGNGADLSERLRRFRHERSPRADAARGLADRIAKAAGEAGRSNTATDAGALLIHAFPDRIAMARGGRGRFLMANGRGAEVPEDDPLAGEPFLVIADLTGQAARGRVLAAAPVSRGTIEAERGDQIETVEECVFDRASLSVRARTVTRLGALVLAEQAGVRPKGERAATALAEGLATHGLSLIDMPKEAAHLIERIGFLHRKLGEPWPNVSPEGLLLSLDRWFTPFQSGVTAISAITAKSLVSGIQALLPYPLAADLDRLAPTHFTAPTGDRLPIRYDGDEPVLAIRVQMLYGLKRHPVIAGGVPLLLELTSPAGRPIQTTRDLTGFWAGSWKDVRADMRGRYPKHLWPEDPANAEATRRAKPRGT